jgi:hypothetical protein
MPAETSSTPEDPQPRSSRLGHLVTSGLLLVLLDIAVGIPQLLAARLLALIILLLLPGALLIAATGVRFASPFVRLASVLAGSVVLIMAWAAVGSAILPLLGVARPLGTGPLLVAVNAIVILTAVFCPVGRDPVLDIFAGTRVTLSPWALLAGAPALAIVGVERLNDDHGSLLVQVSIGLVAAVVIVGFRQASREHHVLAQAFLFMGSLSLLYLYSYRGVRLFGFDIQQEYQRFAATLAAGRWAPPRDGDPYAAMLSITALPAALSKLTSISGVYLFKGLYPIFTAFVPGLVYEFARRWLPGRAAFVGAAYLVALADFTAQLPALARQEVAFFFFSLLIVALFAPELTGLRRTGTVGVLLGALVVSHYSTSYVAVGLFVAAWLIYSAIRLASAVWARALRKRATRAPTRQGRPAIGIIVVAAGVAMVLIWDVAITNSSSNVTQFVTSLADNGIDILPNAQGGSVVNGYLDGNLPVATGPAEYYAEVEAAVRSSQPWLHPFPVAVTSRFTAGAAPAPASLRALIPGSRAVLSDVETILDEAFIGVIVIGVAMSFFDRGMVGHSIRRRRGPRVPLEVAALGLAFVAFLALVRFSGTVVGSYNSDRAQLQGAIILAVPLGLAAEWAMSRARAAAAIVVVGALIALMLYGTGETEEVTGGDAPVVLANAGTGYETFVISNGEASAAR